MNTQSDVDRGLAIRREMHSLGQELEMIEARLRQTGMTGTQRELTDPAREGRQYLAHGTEAAVPVIFTADLLRKSFQDGGAYHAEISRLAETHLRQFYKPENTWKSLFDSGKKFRIHAASVLGNAAPAFITACVARDRDGIARSAVKIEWDRALRSISLQKAA